MYNSLLSFFTYLREHKRRYYLRLGKKVFENIMAGMAIGAGENIEDEKRALFFHSKYDTLSNKEQQAVILYMQDRLQWFSDSVPEVHSATEEKIADKNMTTLRTLLREINVEPCL